MKTCLVVDDSRVIRKIARRMLESLDFAVAEAADGREALARCREDAPDLVLLDWNMPVMGGMDFLRALRATDIRRQPKVVFCTTETDATQIVSAMAAGADEYVLKPFDRATLQTKLEHVGVA